MGQNKPLPETPRPQPPQPPVTYTSSRFRWYGRHGLAGVPPHDPCPAITVSGMVCQRLLQPYTPRPHPLKNQLHSMGRVMLATLPPQPSGATAHTKQQRRSPPTGRRSSMPEAAPHTLAAVMRRERCPGNGQNLTLLASPLLRISFLVNFWTFLSLWPFKNTSKKIAVIIYFSEVSILATSSDGATLKKQAGLHHERCPALRTPSVFFVATSPCHERVICTPATFLCMWKLFCAPSQESSPDSHHPSPAV